MALRAPAIGSRDRRGGRRSTRFAHGPGLLDSTFPNEKQANSNTDFNLGRCGARREKLTERMLPLVRGSLFERSELLPMIRSGSCAEQQVLWVPGGASF